MNLRVTIHGIKPGLSNKALFYQSATLAVCCATPPFDKIGSDEIVYPLHWRCPPSLIKIHPNI